MRALALLVIAPACAPDLPEAFRDARPVEALRQAECSGNPYESPPAEAVTSALLGAPLEVAVREAHFRCAQDVEAYWIREGDQLDLLIQPIDMNPAQVAGCDCLYDLDIEVTSTPEPPTTLTVWRRWDSLNTPNDPVQIGEVVLGPDGPVSR